MIYSFPKLEYGARQRDNVRRLLRGAACLLPLWLGVPAVFGQSDQVIIDTGILQGSTSGAVTSFKGVPFAAPPVGVNRWRPPQPLKHWAGIRSAIDYAPECMQLSVADSAAPNATKPSENCLYLNVWRPGAAAPKGRLPVMFWIHGGGFVNGGTSPAIFDGTGFAESNVILVSANYRLGRFGFFAFPQLTRENPEGLLGNYGLMDQIAALEWVKRNIEAFGGDPDNVTIFGESAGGYSVDALLTSPFAVGLFSKAIIQSGGGRAHLGGPHYLSVSAPNGMPSAEDVGIRFAESLGIQGTGAKALAALRALPAERICGKLQMFNLGDGGFFGPMIDGKLIVGEPQSILLSGAGARGPLMVGANTGDLGFFPAENKEALFASFGIYKAAAAAAYDPRGTADLLDLSKAVGRDRLMIEPARFTATAFSLRGLPTYAYRFGYVAESMRAKSNLAGHASDVPFVFNTLAEHGSVHITDADRNMARAMFQYWVAFAKTGDPNSADLPPWPNYTPQDDVIMDFSESGPKAVKDPLKARLDVTSSYVSEYPSKPIAIDPPRK